MCEHVEQTFTTGIQKKILWWDTGTKVYKRIKKNLSFQTNYFICPRSRSFLLVSEGSSSEPENVSFKRLVWQTKIVEEKSFSFKGLLGLILSKIGQTFSQPPQSYKQNLPSAWLSQIPDDIDRMFGKISDNITDTQPDLEDVRTFNSTSFSYHLSRKKEQQIVNLFKFNSCQLQGFWGTRPFKNNIVLK